MESNTHSTQGSPLDQLAALEAAVDDLAAQDLEGLSAGVRAEQVLRLRRLLDCLEGHWLRQLAAVDAAGDAGADQDSPAPSTASWLRNRLRMGAGAAAGMVRTARALFGGSCPLTLTAAALTNGELSVAHASVIAPGTHDLPDHLRLDAEPVLVEAAGWLDPPRLRQALGQLRLVVDPDNEASRAEQRHQRRGLWLAATWEGMVAVEGLLEAEAGQTLLAALEPLSRPQNALDTRSGGQRRADALAELARRNLEGGRLPQSGGVRPQLLVTMDLDTLLGRPGAVGGDLGWAGPLDPEGCRRLACDRALTRILVTRDPSGAVVKKEEPGGWLRAAMTMLPPILGGAPSQPLDVGRATRVIQPAQRAALTVRDGGCVFPDCDRLLAWCEAHHLVHWLDGGPTDLANLALLCRAHDRAMHEGGWRLERDPDGHLTATPPQRRHSGRRHHTAA
jgi:hypothetical protein